MIFTPAILQQIKERCDLPEIVGTYIGLNRYLKALCPFHQEKTPSFSVHKKKKIWHCFGCHAGGDVIAFVQRIENISFHQAVAKLAAMAGVSLPKSAKFQSFINRRFDRIQQQLPKIAFLRATLKDYEITRDGELRIEWRGLILKQDKDAYDFLRRDLIEFYLFDELDDFIWKVDGILKDLERRVRLGEFL